LTFTPFIQTFLQEDSREVHILLVLMNMIGAYPRTSTFALSNATLPYIKLLAHLGVKSAIRSSEAMRSALNTLEGKLTNQAVGDAHAIEVTEHLF